jgi:ubiquinone/menaquinone biosynthesis C-methylase UbiE
LEESERIAAEFARRATEIPGELYSATTPAQLSLRQERERVALAMLRREGMLPLNGRRVLDVGCGWGQWLVDFETWGVGRDRLAGVDLIEDRVAGARRRVPGADLRVGDASSLPWAPGEFDIVVQSTVFSSILEAEMRRAVAAEMRRVLAPGGVVLWYDFFVGNPRNRAVRGVTRRELRELFPGMRARARRVTLAPPVARRLAPRAYPLAAAVQAARVLDTHLLATLRPVGA